MHDEYRRRLNTFIIGMCALCLAEVILICTAGCSPWTQAARATLAARIVGDQVDQAIADMTRKKTAECLKLHAPKTLEYDACVKEWRVRRDNWRLKSRPHLSALVGGSFRGIQLGKMAGANPKDIAPLALRAICAASEIAAQYGPLFPKEVRAGIMGALAIAKVVTCK